MATTRYYNNDTGNDTTGDGSVGNPYKTEAKARTFTSVPGDIHDFATPTTPYDETFTVQQSGASGNPIIYRANAAQGCVIDRGGASVIGFTVNGHSHVKAM